MPGQKKAIPGASPKMDRMYHHVKAEEVASGKPAATAKRIAAAVTNKQRAATGEAKTTKGHANPRHK